MGADAESVRGCRQREAILRLWATPGVGPMLGRRLIEAFGDAERILDASTSDLRAVRGIGADKASKIRAALGESDERLSDELARCAERRVELATLGEPGYPALLAQAPDAPLVLAVRGSIAGPERDYPVAMVGSRRCTPYGLEQADRFATRLSESGLVVVSGGARGIDSAAHRAALRARARTIVVLGCGLAHCYPPENRDLFDAVVDAGGCIVSELPVDSAPSPENFPARNRIIAAMSLGTVVIEAPNGSGALITARLALEAYGREVMVVPGRIDSPASAGSNDLLKQGGAALVTEPGDVIDALEGGARHLFDGSPALRMAASRVASSTESGAPARPVLSDQQSKIFEALEEPLTLSELCRATSLESSVIQAETTVLEIRRIVQRIGGGRLARA